LASQALESKLASRWSRNRSEEIPVSDISKYIFAHNVWNNLPDSVEDKHNRIIEISKILRMLESET